MHDVSVKNFQTSIGISALADQMQCLNIGKPPFVSSAVGQNVGLEELANR